MPPPRVSPFSKLKRSRIPPPTHAPAPCRCSVRQPPCAGDAYSFPHKRIARGGDLKGNAAFAHDSTDKDIDGRGRRHAELGAYGVKLLLEFRIHTDIECRLYHNSLILSFFLCTLSAEKIFPGQEQNAFCSGKALSRNGLPRSPVSAGAYDIAGGALLFVVQSAVQARQRRQQALVYGAQALQVPHQCLLPLP